MKITNIQAIEILDSRGNPTIRTFVTLTDKSVHTASVPSGASTGSYEAVELRDDDLKRYRGKGVLHAVKNVNTIIRDAVIHKDADPKEIDRIMLELDGTENKEKLGANAILSVSMAVVRSAAHIKKVPLWKYLNSYYFATEVGFPKLMVNIINGGMHSSWHFDIQEFMIVPNTTTPTDSIRIASEIFHALGSILKEKRLGTLVGAEGGYSPQLRSHQDAFELILEAATKAGYENVKDFRLSIDAAASEFYKDNGYHLRMNPEIFDAQDLTNYYAEIGQQYKILSFEDAFSEDDYKAFAHFEEMAEKFQFINIGDDLFTTNPTKIALGIKEKLANGVLIKLNQIGTVSETAEAINIAKRAEWVVAVSHRSGETEDNFIADLAYSCGADFFKSGSMSRSERLSKYNRLLEIECNL